MWLSRLRDTEPPVQPADADGGRRPSAVLNATVLLVGDRLPRRRRASSAPWTSSSSAFAEEEGAPALAGLALAVYAGGSLVAGLVYGVARLPGTLAARFVGCAVFFAAGRPAAVGRGLAGHARRRAASWPGWPSRRCSSRACRSWSPGCARSALTEALAWVVTGLTLGVTAGSAVAGSAVDAWGAETAFAVPALAAALAGVLALAGAPAAAPARRGAGRASAGRNRPG